MPTKDGRLTKSEVLAGLKDKDGLSQTETLTEAFKNPDECFGKEYDASDKACSEDCADAEACKRVFEAPKDSEAVQPARAPEVKTDVTGPEQTNVIPTEESMPNETVQEDANVDEALDGVEVKTQEAPEKPKPKGFGDSHAKKDDFGFTEGTKGSFIAKKIVEAPITKADLTNAADEKFESNSAGRVNMVMYKLRDKGYKLERAGKMYFLVGYTPADAIEVVRNAYEAEVAAKKPSKKAASNEENPDSLEEAVDSPEEGVDSSEEAVD